jgi:DNA-binding protein HU-beta
MVRKTMRMLVVAMIAAFALSSVAEAATPKKSTRHRTKHSSRVSSGAAPTNATQTTAKKKPAGTSAKASSTASSKPAAKKAPAKPNTSTKPK